MRAPSQTQSGMRLCSAAGLASVMLLAGACASTPPAPTRSLDAARTAISTAERANAGRFAAAELGEARDKLALADRAATAENMLEAERLADQALVQAELATARTDAAKAMAVNNDMRKGNDVLREEMQRTGDQR